VDDRGDPVLAQARVPSPWANGRRRKSSAIDRCRRRSSQPNAHCCSRPERAAASTPAAWLLRRQSRHHLTVEIPVAGRCSRTRLSGLAGDVRGVQDDSWMAQNFISCDRGQVMLLPPSLTDWLAEDHLAWTVLGAVEQMDLEGFYGAYRANGQGRAAYDPAMMA
jgi:hypothetical protein